MSNSILPLLPLAGLLACVACDAPKSTQPLGAHPLPLQSNEWAGSWTTSDGELQVRIADPGAGMLEIAQLEAQEQGFEITTSRLLLRRQDEAILFNLIESEEGRTNYVFGRLVQTDRAIVGWWAGQKSIERLATEGFVTLQLSPGSTDGPPVVSSGHDALARRLASPDGWSLLEMEHPFTLIRIRSAP